MWKRCRKGEKMHLQNYYACIRYNVYKWTTLALLTKTEIIMYCQKVTLAPLNTPDFTYLWQVYSYRHSSSRIKLQSRLSTYSPVGILKYWYNWVVSTSFHIIYMLWNNQDHTMECWRKWIPYLGRILRSLPTVNAHCVEILSNITVNISGSLTNKKSFSVGSKFNWSTADGILEGSSCSQIVQRFVIMLSNLIQINKWDKFISLDKPHRWTCIII